jgi:NADH dehydrogenase FAD-containing subunit
MMDIQPLMPWLSFFALVISVGSSVTMFMTSGAKKNATTLSDHESRISKVENDIKHMPDKESVHKLQLDLTEMKGQIGIMAKSSEVTERTTRRVEEFLLSRRD